MAKKYMGIRITAIILALSYVALSIFADFTYTGTFEAHSFFMVLSFFLLTDTSIYQRFAIVMYITPIMPLFNTLLIGLNVLPMFESADSMIQLFLVIGSVILLVNQVESEKKRSGIIVLTCVMQALFFVMILFDCISVTGTSPYRDYTHLVLLAHATYFASWIFTASLVGGVKNDK